MPSRLLLRLWLPLVGLSLLLLTTSGLTAWYLHNSNLEAAQAAEAYLVSTQSASQLQQSLTDLREHIARYERTGDVRRIQAARQIASQIEVRLVETYRLEVSPEGRKTLRLIQQHYEEVSRTLPILVEAQAAVEPSVLARWLAEEALPLAIQEASVYRAATYDRLDQAIENSKRTTVRVGRLLWLLAVAGVGIGLLGGYAMARTLQQSIVELSVPVRDTAGKLSEVIGPWRLRGSKNIEELRRDLDEMFRQVVAVVEKLQAAQRENLRAEQLAATGQLAAGLAHELRNPLTAMKTLVQAARQQEGAALDARDLEVLEEEMTHLNEAIQTFLDFARPPTLRRRAVHIAEVIQRTLQLAAPHAAQQGVVLSTDVAPDLPDIQADAEQLRQMLLNLVLNSLDALPDGGHVEISARVGRSPAADGADALIVQVADDGSGLPEELGDRIFEPFVSTRDSGTGLGLAICRRIAESHGGTIAASRRPEGGTLFTIRLPITAQGSD